MSPKEIAEKILHPLKGHSFEEVNQIARAYLELENKHIAAIALINKNISTLRMWTNPNSYLGSELLDLSNVNSKFLADNFTFQNSYLDLKSEITKLKEENTKVKEENERLNSYVISGYEIMHKEMQEEIAKLKNENEKLLRVNKNLVEENDGLRAALTRNKLNNLSTSIHKTNVEAGWWTDLATGEPLERNVGELLCLVHSEISEALEAYRKDLNDDKLPHRKGFEVELADALIRIFDIAGKFMLDLDGAIEEKMTYNAKRADHKLENRQGANGKKF